MVKTAKNRSLKKIIAGVAAATMVIAAGSAIAVSAANYYTFDPTVGFTTNIGDGHNVYQTTRLEPCAYNNFTIPANVSAKSYVRISCSGGDTKATNTYAATAHERTVTSDRVNAASLLPYSMNMSVTRGNQQVDNYYTALNNN